MKKITIYFLIIGIICVIIGGLGSGFYFTQIRDDYSKVDVNEYKIVDQKKSESVHLKITGDSVLTISTAKTDSIRMQTSTSLYPAKNTLDVKETDDSLAIDINMTQERQQGFPVNIYFLSRSTQTELIIPENVKNLTIDGDFSGQLIVDGTKIDDLTIDSENTELSLQSITSKKLSIKTDNSIFISDDSKAEDVDITTNYGSVNLIDSHATQWNINSKSGYISLFNLTGDIQVNSVDGEITASDIKNNLVVKNKNGDFSLYGSIIPEKIEVTSIQGSIDIILDGILDDINLTAKSKYGSTTIYGEDTSSYRSGNESSLFNLSTDSGDIYIE